MTTVLAIVAHPDDEVLGCGGTLARHAAAGDKVYSLIVGEGATSRRPSDGAPSTEHGVAALRAAAANAATALGATTPRMLGLPDNRLDSLDLLDIVKPIEQVLSELRPSIVYTHFEGDLNIDHRLTAQAVLTACRPLPDCPVMAIFAFETPSSSEWANPIAVAAFRPQRFVDISEFWQAKQKALVCYASELRDFPHPRSLEAVEALARWRGASAGVHVAEAFEVIRERVI